RPHDGCSGSRARQSRLPGGAVGEPDRRSDETCRYHRVHVAAGGPDRQRGGEPRFRAAACRRHPFRTARLPFPLCDRRSERRHAGLYRKAAAELEKQIGRGAYLRTQITRTSDARISLSWVSARGTPCTARNVRIASALTSRTGERAGSALANTATCIAIMPSIRCWLSRTAAPASPAIGTGGRISMDSSLARRALISAGLLA